MERTPPRSTRTAPLFPYTPLFRARGAGGVAAARHARERAGRAYECGDQARAGTGDRGFSRRLTSVGLCRTNPLAAPQQKDYIAGIMSHARSEEHTSELQSLMRISYAVFCFKKKKINY